MDEVVLKLMEDRRKYLSLDWLVTVATTRDTELRCHRVALTYSQYAAYLDLWLFEKQSYWYRHHEAEPTADETRRTNANWFHFSTWAALTVSRNIGSIAAPQRFDGLPNVVRQGIAPYVVRARATDHQRVSQALAGAQLRIFVNTCVAFMETWGIYTRQEVEAAGLKPDDEMRELACRGFRFYQLAKKKMKKRRARCGSDMSYSPTS